MSTEAFRSRVTRQPRRARGASRLSLPPEDPSTERARLYLLGPARAERNGGPLRGFESRKALAVLCYLADTGQPCPRSRLADLFWGEKPESRGRANLSRVIHNLSRLVPGSLNGEPDHVELRPGRIWTDVGAFTTFEAGGDVASLARAVALHRGTFLAGLHLDECEEFTTWLDARREHWRRRVASSLHRLLEHHTRRREHEPALRYAACLLELEPWCEEAHRDLMRALARSGQRSAALAQYETCQRVLASEIGVGPSNATETLACRIKAMADQPAGTLPAETTAFVGRERELAEIAERIADPDCRLLTLVAAGGSGKTRLALRTARAEGRGFLDGTYFVSLGDVASEDVLITSIADAIGLSLEGPSDAKRRLTSYLASRETLLVLDAFEHLVPGGLDLVLEMLRHATQLKLLVTSRQRLRVRDEWLYEVHGLTVPDDGTPGRPPEAYSGVRLFLEGVRRVRPEAPIAVEDLPLVTRICQRLGGLPLGIELAAAWLSRFTVPEVEQRVRHDVASLGTGLNAMPARHASLRKVLDDSWALLSPAEQEVFQRLSVFRGGFNDDAARVVADAAPDHLAALVDKSILHREPEGRYQIHDVLREDAEARLAASGAAQQCTRDRHSAYYCRFLEGAGLWPPSRKIKRALGRVAGEMANVRAAWTWAVTRQMTGEVRRAAPALAWFHEVRGRHRQGAWAFKTAVAGFRDSSSRPAARRADRDATLGVLLSRYAWLRHRVDDMQDAIATSREAERLLRATRAEGELAFTKTSRAILVWLTGDFSTAARQLRAALLVARRVGDTWSETWATGFLGWACESLGDMVAAEGHLRDALRLNQGPGDPVLDGLALVGLGRVAWGLERLEQAKARFERALEMSTDTGHEFGAALTRTDLGAVAFEMGELANARRCFDASLAMFEEMEERWGLARCRSGLGKVALRCGQHALARRYFEESLDAAGAVQAAPVILECFVGVAELFGQARDVTHASQLLEFTRAHPAATLPTRRAAARALCQLPAGASAARQRSNHVEPESSLEDMVKSALADLRSL